MTIDEQKAMEAAALENARSAARALGEAVVAAEWKAARKAWETAREAWETAREAREEEDIE